jgi:hypothetical protein
MNPSDPKPYMFHGKVQSVEITQSEGFADRLRRFARLQPDNAWANYYYAVSLWKRRTSILISEGFPERHPGLSKSNRCQSWLGGGAL